MEAGDIDTAAEIVGGSKGVRTGMGEQFIQKGLLGGKVGVLGERQAHPV